MQEQEHGELRLSLIVATTGVMAVFGVHVFRRRGPFVFDAWPELARVENCPPRRNSVTSSLFMRCHVGFLLRILKDRQLPSRGFRE